MLLSRAEWKRASAERARASARVKDMVRLAFALGPDDAVAANEVACPDPGCPDVETIVLLMRAGEPTRALKIARPIAEVTDADVRGLLATPQSP